MIHIRPFIYIYIYDFISFEFSIPRYKISIKNNKSDKQSVLPHDLITFFIQCSAVVLIKNKTKMIFLNHVQSAAAAVSRIVIDKYTSIPSKKYLPDSHIFILSSSV